MVISKKRLNILITNDDGIKSEAVELLRKIASEIGECIVVCPDTNMSCISKALHSPRGDINYRKDTLLSGESNKVYSVSGTPADCVIFGMNSKILDKPDIILSGINKGLNTGYTTAISGTFGATEIAVLNGLKAIAFSYPEFVKFTKEDERSILQYKEYFKKLINHVAFSGQENVSINVSIPRNPKGVKIATQSKCWFHPVFKESEVISNGFHSENGIPKEGEESKGDDFDVCRQSFIAVTPIKIGPATCKRSFEELEALEENTRESEFKEKIVKQ